MIETVEIQTMAELNFTFEISPRLDLFGILSLFRISCFEFPIFIRGVLAR